MTRARSLRGARVGGTAELRDTRTSGRADSAIVGTALEDSEFANTVFVAGSMTTAIWPVSVLPPRALLAAPAGQAVPAGHTVPGGAVGNSVATLRCRMMRRTNLLFRPSVGLIAMV
ncbi:MAG: hypothetical protein MUQ30_11115 [Anaerolineae bacterium]|nr:hypothetical protein [Anaerolineae bacterium]